MPTNKQAIDWITRTLAFLGACCVITVCVLSFRGLQIPPELNTLTGGLVGSLASMLVKTTPTEQTGVKTQDVKLVNPPDDPANTKEAPIDPIKP